MFRQHFNDCRILVDIDIQGPTLINTSPDSGSGLNMAFVRTAAGEDEEVYLPGSSLKGALRSQGERIANSLKENAVCNIFNDFFGYYKRNKSEKDYQHREGVPSCNNVLQQYKYLAGKWSKDHPPLTGPDAYRVTCPACKLFGSLEVAGRFNIADAYVDPKVPAIIEHRDGVGIDRFSGGAANGAKYEYEVVVAGRFSTEITLQNFELWQLSWLSYLLRDMEEGRLPIGMGTSRGLGQIKAQVKGLEWRVLGLSEVKSFQGLGAFVEENRKRLYGFDSNQSANLPKNLSFKNQGIFAVLHADSEQAKQIFECLQGHFPQYIQSAEHMFRFRQKHKLCAGFKTPCNHLFEQEVQSRPPKHGNGRRR